MTGEGHNSGAGQLRAFVERIERLEEEIKSMNADKSEIYKEAKATGFNVKVLRKVVSARRQDYSERQEIDSLFDMYMAALGEAPESLVRARVEIIEEIPQSVVGSAVARTESAVHSAAESTVLNSQRPTSSPKAADMACTGAPPTVQATHSQGAA